MSDPNPRHFDATSLVQEHDWDAAENRARDERKLLLVHVEKEDCIGCELLGSIVYPNPAVAAAIDDNFILLRLDHKDPKVRELNIIWLPTVLVRDLRGQEHGRHVNAAPPEDFLDFLALGEAHARMRTASYARAEQVLAEALARRPDGPLHPELLYWHAIAGYWKGHHDGEFRDRVWTDLRQRYPDSIWTHRVPEYLSESVLVG
jgi:hypothetical protein